MEPPKRGLTKALFYKLGALVFIAIVAGFFVLRGLDWRTLFNETMGAISAAGPWVFFTARALLPAAGAPLMAFTLTAGPAFESELGLGGVLAACATSLFINLSLTYWLSRRWLRPWLEKLVIRAGYKVPQVAREDQFEVALLVRITPGPPHFLQSYLLGLAEIPFWMYLAISWTILMLYTVGLVIFGGALVNGKGGEALLGISLFVAVLLIIHILRRHYAKRRNR
ncbi:MAG: VTT domain-containing protein [Verrucomicrobiota bacterium]|nr:VTT domain-containing protein [Verrucomicrobiota bacterium]